MQFEFAPMEGVTTFLFRAAHHRRFGGVDRYFMPFFSPTQEHLFTRRDLRDLAPERNANLPVVPQVMTRVAADFLWAAGELAQMGYQEVNLNLGCPSGTVVAKGKGSGFLARPAELDRFLEEIYAASPLPISIKTRLGMQAAAEFWPLLEIYNRYPVKEVIVHTRVQKDFYKRPARPAVFAQILQDSRNPVCYNGDLYTQEKVEAFQMQFPQTQAVMLGRGAIADPALARKLHGGTAASREELCAFTQELYEGYCSAYGGAGPAAQRMKELWFYLIALFEGGEGYAKKMRRLTRPQEYEALAAGIFRDLPLLPAAGAPWETA